MCSSALREREEVAGGGRGEVLSIKHHSLKNNPEHSLCLIKASFKERFSREDGIQSGTEGRSQKGGRPKEQQTAQGTLYSKREKHNVSRVNLSLVRDGFGHPRPAGWLWMRQPSTSYMH